MCFSLRWADLMWSLRLSFRENLSWQISHSWGCYLRWIAVMCFWRWPFSENLFWHNSSSWGFSFRWTTMICFWRMSFRENLSWQNFTLMRLLFEVDCSDVLLEFAFLWKSILATHTHEASLSGGLQRCAFGYGLSLKIYFGKTHPQVWHQQVLSTILGSTDHSRLYMPITVNPPIFDHFFLSLTRVESPCFAKK